MAAEPNTDLQLEIGHVLFVDIVAYSKLTIDEQRDVQRELNDVVRSSEQFRLSDAAGKLVRLPTGDGMALVFRDSMEAPVRCAAEIAKALRAQSRIQLRLGIHSGPVSDVTDVNERANIAGDGANIAQRVMACGDAGHILLSKRVAEDLAHYGRWRPQLHELGEVELKHGVKIDIFNLCGDGIGNPELPEKIARKRHELEIASRTLAKRSRTRRHAFIGIAAGVAGLAIALAMFAYQTRRKLVEATNAANASFERSVAVLPFENLSKDAENAFVTTGIQDEILTRLAKIAALKVIARASTRGYESRPTNLPVIAKELGVATILEGSVQKVGDRLRVNVQLIKASTAMHLWAETYDRNLTDLFSVESEVATKIASALQATLSPEEKVRLAAIPTNNREAYAAYLRAHQTLYGEFEDERELPPLYQRVIALDPNFALAHAELSMAHSFIYLDVTPQEEHKRKARAEAEEALRLQPDLGEAHEALGSYFYRVERDYDAALKEYAIAARALPNDPELVRNVAAMRRRQGHWRQAVIDLQRAVSLDPRNLMTLDYLADTYSRLHERDSAKPMRQRSAAVAANSSAFTARLAKLALASEDWYSRGDWSSVRAVVDNVPPNEDLDGTFAFVRYTIGMFDRNYDAAARELASTSATQFEFVRHTFTPKSYFEGCIELAKGNVARAKPLFESALPVIEKQVAQNPASASAHGCLGLLYAHLGRGEDAIREGRRAVELPPEAGDAVDGPPIEIVLATIYARTGESDQALPMIERLLTTPGGIVFVELRSWWEWDPLRKDPRFQEIVAGPEPKVVYK